MAKNGKKDDNWGPWTDKIWAWQKSILLVACWKCVKFFTYCVWYDLVLKALLRPAWCGDVCQSSGWSPGWRGWWRWWKCGGCAVNTQRVNVETDQCRRAAGRVVHTHLEPTKPYTLFEVSGTTMWCVCTMIHFLPPSTQLSSLNFLKWWSVQG